MPEPTVFNQKSYYGFDCKYTGKDKNQNKKQKQTETNNMNEENNK